MTLVKFNQSNSFPIFVDRFFHGDPFEAVEDFLNKESRFVPAVNIRETSQAFFIELAVPGRKREDFKATLNNKLLTVTVEGALQNVSEEVQGKFNRREFGYEKFERSFTLPETVSQDQIKAHYEAGVLSIELPKKEEAKQKSPRTIDIL